MFQRNILPPSSGPESDPSKNPTEAGGFLLGLLFNPEDRGNKFL
jgi:hypothetical protein